MPVRHLLLAIAAVLVTGMCIYLFLQVRSSPAVAQPHVVSKDDDDDKPARSTPTEPTKFAGTAGIRGMPKQAGNDAKPSEPAPATEPVAEPVAEGKLEGPKLDAVMAEANKAYDKMDFEEARSIAQRVLKQQPANTRMLRIMTSSFCIEVDGAEAQKWFNLLPGPDRDQMKVRCARYGVTFTDPPAK